MRKLTLIPCVIAAIALAACGEKRDLGAHRGVRVAVGRQQDSLRVRIKLDGASEKFHAGHLWHPLVNQEQPYRIISLF